MKLLKSILTILLCAAVLLLAVFLIGRYGWKLGGFRACESAGIEQVNVEENQVRICGFYPGSFPRGFLGYHAEQVDSTLYVGFKFSGLFGIFETGDFDITIPTNGTVSQVVIKTSKNEYLIWPEEDEPLCRIRCPQKAESMSVWSGTMCIPWTGILKTKAAAWQTQTVLR